MGSRTWIKIYCDKWIEGTLRQESLETRGIWIDLLALVGTGKYGDTGELQLAPDVGFTDEQISGILKIPILLWSTTKELLVKTERISINNNNSLHILKWDKYQSEYARQKPYRAQKENIPTTLKEKEIRDRDRESKVVTKSYKKKLQPLVTKDTIRKSAKIITSEEMKCSDWYRTDFLKRYTQFKEQDWYEALTWLSDHPGRQLNKSFLINWAKGVKPEQVAKKLPGHRVPDKYTTPEELLNQKGQFD